MVFKITQGRNKVCKDSQGGINKIYLFKYVNYLRSEIILNNNVLVTYPATTIYPFEVDNQPSISQTQTEENGNKYFDLKIDFELVKENGFNYESFLNFNFNIIAQDRNGNFRFLGNRNGLECNNIQYTTGGGKTDFNGVKLSFEGKEEKEAWYIDSLNGAGFTIAGEDTNEYLLQENGDFLLQEDGFKIIL